MIISVNMPVLGLLSKEQGGLIGHLTQVPSCSAVVQNVLIVIYHPSLSEGNNVLFMGVCLQCRKHLLLLSSEHLQIYN